MTNCEIPPELAEKTLLLYLDGEAAEETLWHLEHCAHCRERAEALDRLQARLTSRLYRVDCPSPMELAEAKFGKLSNSQKLVIEQHLRQCLHCTREVAQLESFFLHESDPQPENRLVETAKVLVAKLVGGELGNRTLEETGFPVAASALRGEAKGAIVFEADGLVITLDKESSPNGQISIHGQLAADDQDEWTGALVRMRQADAPELTTFLDDLGAFVFEQVHPGSVQFRFLSANGIEVQILDVNIAM